MNNNTISVIGYVGKHIRVKKMADSNNKVVKFSVGVREYSANKDKQTTLWFDVDAWNGLGDRVEQLVTTGREIKIDGRLALNTYNGEKDGVKYEITRPVIKLTSFYLCGRKPAGKDESQGELTFRQDVEADDYSSTDSDESPVDDNQSHLAIA